MGHQTHLVFKLCFLVAFVISFSVLGLAQPQPRWIQPERPGDIACQVAEAKARFFARMEALATEPTPNQNCYDAKYYHLDLNIDPATQTVSGGVEMRAEVTTGPLSQVDVDLYSNMTVDSITSASGNLTFSHANDILTVNLDRSYSTGEAFSFTVYYHGTPSSSAGAFAFESFDGEDMIWSLSEPFGARTWWPCKDYPNDKPDSVDIWITVPSNLIDASNGVLRATIDNGSTKTYKWHEGYPIATYLVSVAIHPYIVYSDYYHYSPTDSMEIRHYVFASHYPDCVTNYAKITDMIGLFANLYGEYPFIEEKYGQAEFTWGGGMEHQTITSLWGWGEYLVLHELSHQWWGDMITCNTFNHIWLNEGFATYSEALWAEHEYGWDEYKNQMEYAKYYGPGTIYVPDLSDWDRIFDPDLSYNKASWVLHMLRGIVGDSTFFDILHAYYNSQYQYGSATTEQFRDICEQVAGRDFDAFFQEWIYGEGFPHYMFSWDYQPVVDGYEISLTIDRLQENQIFNMPIQISVTTASGETTLVVEDSLASQQFTLLVSDEPQDVQLDKDEWILRMVSEELKDATFDRGILVVNGVDWNTYGTEITSAYEDSIFWGSLDISFWDIFAEPAGGYPSPLPQPLGHGDIPADTLKQFSSVVWVGNNYNGDLTAWYNAPIVSYLKAGGNVLLLTRMGQDFIYEALRAYLDIQWAEDKENTTRRATSVYPGLVDMPRSGGSQTYNAVFDSASVGDESTVLFMQYNMFPIPRGLGVWRNPSSGGTQRADGGQFVFIAGRPYRYDHDAMRSNCEFILRNFFGEPYNPSGIADEIKPRIWLGQNTPNPFVSATRIKYSLSNRARVLLSIYDVRGREVTRLVDEVMDAGNHTVSWNGRDRWGENVASGVYWYLLKVDDRALRRKLVLIK